MSINIKQLIKNAWKKYQLLLLNLIYWGFFLCSMMVKYFYFQFTTKISQKPFINIYNFRMLIVTFSMLLIISAVLFALFNKKRNPAVLITDILLSVLLLADTLFFRYYHNLISIPVLYNLGAADQLGGSIASLFKHKDIVYILDLPFLAGLFFLLRKKGATAIRFTIRAVAAALTLLVSIGSIFYVYGKTDTRSFHLDNNYVARYLGVLYFHCYDTKRFVADNLFENRNLTEAEQQAVEAFYAEKADEGDRLKGIAKGKNLIMIQLEAFQEFVINRKINGREITPNLNKLIEESLYFDNIYYQIADGNTSDAEFLSNTSLYPLREGSVFIRYSTNTYHSLGKELKKQGYSTYAFHANRPSFWNRAAMYNSLGFDRFFNINDYVQDDKVGWTISDNTFLRQSMDLFETDKPFYSFFITLSTHYPYNFDYSSLGILDVGKYKDTLLGSYLKGAYYVDRCIGRFLKDLKARGLYDNSVIVIYGDHQAIPKEESMDLAEFLGVEYNDFELAKLQKVPLIIRVPGLDKGETISTTGGEIDIYPTLANLMDLEAPYALGKDLVNAEKGYAVLRNASFVTDDYIYINELAKAFDIDTGNILPETAYRQEMEALMEQYQLSQIIIKKDAFKRITE